jgi:hypothetical protein
VGGPGERAALGDRVGMRRVGEGRRRSMRMIVASWHDRKLQVRSLLFQLLYPVTCQPANV